MTPVAVCACVTTLFSQQAKAASWCDLEISQGGPPQRPQEQTSDVGRGWPGGATPHSYCPTAHPGRCSPTEKKASALSCLVLFSLKRKNETSGSLGWWQEAVCQPHPGALWTAGLSGSFRPPGGQCTATSVARRPWDGAGSLALVGGL